MRMGGGPQQFGVDAEQVPALLKELADAEVDLLGFHVFAGSQNLRADVVAEAQRKAVDLVSGWRRTRRPRIRYLNLGGGFGIPYFEKDFAGRGGAGIRRGRPRRTSAFWAPACSTKSAIWPPGLIPGTHACTRGGRGWSARHPGDGAHACR